MRTVSWNKIARQDYFEIIEFLSLNWSEKEVQNFIDKVYDIRSILVKGNVEFQSTDRIGIKRCVINKQITLFYKIVNESHVELLRFWNNSKNMRSLKY